MIEGEGSFDLDREGGRLEPEGFWNCIKIGQPFDAAMFLFLAEIMGSPECCFCGR